MAGVVVTEAAGVNCCGCGDGFGVESMVVAARVAALVGTGGGVVVFVGCAIGVVISTDVFAVDWS